MADEKQKQIIDQMQTAFDEFKAHMAELESRAGGLVKESLQEIDKEKIEAVLADIKKITQK